MNLKSLSFIALFLPAIAYAQSGSTTSTTSGFNPPTAPKQEAPTTPPSTSNTSPSSGANFCLECKFQDEAKNNSPSNSGSNPSTQSGDKLKPAPVTGGVM